jgi:SAM-dependent methyltransferase
LGCILLLYTYICQNGITIIVNRMHINEIKKTWVTQSTNPHSGVNMWDSQAEDPIYNITPTFQDNKFLQLLDQEHMIDPTCDVLDIGCGVGVYAMAMASRVHSATGIDFSPKMIQKGKEKLEKEKISNITLSCIDWSKTDLTQLGFKGRFDLVFAHTTPAICDAVTFEKMNEASRHFCAISNPGKMNEPVLQKIQKLVGLDCEPEDCEAYRIYALDMLFQMGYLPKLAYEPQIWPMNQPYENACSYYLGRVAAMGKHLTPNDTAKVRDYLDSIAKDGRVIDEIDTIVTTLYWEK